MNESDPPELVALLATLDDIDPLALTSCPGWTAHHLAAHIAGNYEEVRRHVEAFADGHPLVRTRSWDEREASLRELDHGALLCRIADEASATMSVATQVLNQEPEAELMWTDRMVSVSGFLSHMRSENALHRWDLVGDDDISAALLGQPDLLKHALEFIGRPLYQRGLEAGAASGSFVARVRSAGLEDLIIEVSHGEATLSLGAPVGDATIEADGAARLLLLWGRKPSPFNRLRQVQNDDGAGRVQLVLAGY